MSSRKTETDVAQLKAWIHCACLLEVTAKKPGNVHPEASFDDLCYDDFVVSADVVAPILARSSVDGVGQTVLDAVAATQAAVGKNTNLGIILLIAPLTAVPNDVRLVDGIGRVLKGLTLEDARFVYKAIRRVNPGGMGEVADGDVWGEPTGTLLEMMELASGRDLIAAQYVNGFEQVLEFGVTYLENRREKFATSWAEVVIGLQLELMSEFPDSLITRKQGFAEAAAASALARGVLEAGWPDGLNGQSVFVKFDRWLREMGHRRNPGTTADLVTSTLFAAFRERAIDPPVISRIFRQVEPSTENAQ